MRAGDLQSLGEELGLDVVGVAPAENPSVAAALMPATRRFGQDVGAGRAKAFGKTERLGARSFFLYGTPVSHGRAMVKRMSAKRPRSRRSRMCRSVSS